MTVMAEELSGKFTSFTDTRHNGIMMALQNVGALLDNKLSHDEFNRITEHVTGNGTEEFSPSRKAFRQGYLDTLGTLMEI